MNLLFDALRQERIKLRLFIPYRLKLVQIHLSRRISLTNSGFLRVDFGKIFSQSSAAHFFHFRIQLRNPGFDFAFFIFALFGFFNGFSIAQITASLGNVIKDASQFERFKFFVKRASAKQIRQKLRFNTIALVDEFTEEIPVKLFNQSISIFWTSDVIWNAFFVNRWEKPRFLEFSCNGNGTLTSSLSLSTQGTGSLSVCVAGFVFSFCDVVRCASSAVKTMYAQFNEFVSNFNSPTDALHSKIQTNFVLHYILLYKRIVG